MLGAAPGVDRYLADRERHVGARPRHEAEQAEQREEELGDEEHHRCTSAS